MNILRLGFHRLRDGGPAICRNSEQSDAVGVMPAVVLVDEKARNL